MVGRYPQCAPGRVSPCPEVCESQMPKFSVHLPPDVRNAEIRGSWPTLAPRAGRLLPSSRLDARSGRVVTRDPPPHEDLRSRHAACGEGIGLRHANQVGIVSQMVGPVSEVRPEMPDASTRLCVTGHCPVACDDGASGPPTHDAADQRLRCHPVFAGVCAWQGPARVVPQDCLTGGDDDLAAVAEKTPRPTICLRSALLATT